MVDEIKIIGDTAPLWVPVLTTLAGRLSMTQPGRKIENLLKNRLGWVKDAVTEKAFLEAFKEGSENFERNYYNPSVAQVVAKVLAHIAEHPTADLDQVTLLRQIFAVQPDVSALRDLVRRYAFAIEGIHVTLDEVGAALETLIVEYLRPTFFMHPHFTERIGFAEIIGLLQNIFDALQQPNLNLEQLRIDYLEILGKKYQDITMQGISPKVQNKTIGIRMEDVFIPLKLRVEQVDWLYNCMNEQFGPKVEPGIFTYHLLEALRVKSDQHSTSIHDIMKYIYEINHKCVNPQLLTLVNDEVIKTSGTRLAITVGELTKLLQSSTNLFTMKRLLRLPSFVVQGDPGSGKSTLTRYVTWAIACMKPELVGESVISKLPIRIRAVEFGDAVEASRVDSLDEYLVEQAGRFEPLIKYMLATGQALILIDGLDEVSKTELRIRVKGLVDDLIADPVFADNQLVITTRIVGYERGGLIGRFPHFTLTELSDEQIQLFIGNWYRAIYDQIPTAIDVSLEQRQLLEAINVNPSIGRMARNPLLLTIIALIKWQGRTLPDQRVLLYDAATQTLIRSWPLTQRRIELDELLIREWLAPVALHIFSERTSDLIDEYTLKEVLVASMRRLKAMTPFEAEQASQSLLENVSLHSGIILPRGVDTDGRNLYGFMHQTFAEYLTAYYLAGRWEDGELALRDYLHDPYWREVLLLMAGHLGTQRRAKAGHLVRDIRNLKSSLYESIIFRDLLLACRILGDGIPIGPGELIEDLLNELLNVWLTTPIVPLRKEIETIFGELANTEYQSVFLRLAHMMPLNDSQTLTLARQFGSESFVASLLPLLNSEVINTKLEAIELLGESSPDGLQELKTRLEDEQQEISVAVAATLARQGYSDAVNTLVSFLASADLHVKCKAAQTLINLNDARGVDALVTVINSGKLGHQIRAVPALLSCEDPSADIAIESLLSNSTNAVRLLIASRLALRNDPRGVETLTIMMDTSDIRLRYQVAAELAKYNVPHAIDELVSLLESDNLDTRFNAAYSLVEVQDQRGRDAFVEILNMDVDEFARYAEEQEFTIDGLQMFIASELAEHNDPRGVEILSNIPDLEAQLTAAAALAKQKDARSITIAGDLLKASDPVIQLQAAALLSTWDDSRGGEVAIRLLEAEKPEIRVLAARLLLANKNITLRKAFAQRINILLDDIDIPTSTVRLLVNIPTPDPYVYSVADVAYLFVMRYLSPSGELLLST